MFMIVHVTPQFQLMRLQLHFVDPVLFQTQKISEIGVINLGRE